MMDIQPRTPAIIPETHAVCGFTTRNGGVSSAPFNSLNLGFYTADNAANVAENHSLLHTFLHIDSAGTALMEQVHGSNVSAVSAGGRYPSTDSLITSNTNIMLGVLVADCIPLLLYDPKRKIIGAIHCGWRPIVDGIAGQALRMFTDEFGSDPSDVAAVMGPSAGPCCYEIGGEVAERLRPSSVISRDGALYADLRAELGDHLSSAGISRPNIEIFPDCTICCGKLYFSHRRDGINSGRMMGYIMMKDKF
ncbi:peptidoglycan editing factor PgeF [Candidatus Latescibacterota bacterium]